MSRNPSVDQILTQLNSVIVGKAAQVQLALTCLLAGGHLLIDDVPGVGKTTLAHALAQTLGLHFSRVQFTSDLLPSDLTGVSVFERNSGSFVFHPGPIFAQVLLADEINRASPKTQSALLEAMEERQVSAEGQTRPLPEPFFVIATQNPHDQIGTHALPESQLDRFLMRISLGYPDKEAERQLLSGVDRRELLGRLRAVVSGDELLALQKQVLAIHASEALIRYVQDVVQASRQPQWFAQGLSPRAGLALLRAARAMAFVQGRDYATPDDVRSVAVSSMAHRLTPPPKSGRGCDQQLLAMLESVALS
ncbi:MAG: hypothetical protein RL758_1593 [Pseudomonadota bacterium]|jgi:MoxR-like ATPase